MSQYVRALHALALFPGLSRLQVIKNWSRGRAGNETNTHLDSSPLLVRMATCGYKVYESTDIMFSGNTKVMKWQLAQSGCSFAVGWRQLYCFSLQLSPNEPVKKKTFTVEVNTNLTSPPTQLLLVSQATPFTERGRVWPCCNH